MRFSWWRAALIAALIFLALFLFYFFTHAGRQPSIDGFVGDQSLSQSQSQFENARKNYASTKQLSATPGPPQGDVQKYEKVGTLSQSTSDFDADRRRILDVTASHQGVIQLERATGLKGHQILHLGIGVPPDKFDAFIEAAKAIGKAQLIDVVKNDKTNEYLQLKAKRTTLEKARTALEELKTSGGSLEERVNVQNRLTEIEEKIQDLGVSLGEFDTQNELCTVKLTLREVRGLEVMSTSRRVALALESTVSTYVLGAIGFLSLIIAGWLAAALIAFVQRLVAQARAG